MAGLFHLGMLEPLELLEIMGVPELLELLEMRDVLESSGMHGLPCRLSVYYLSLVEE